MKSYKTIFRKSKNILFVVCFLFAFAPNLLAEEATSEEPGIDDPKVAEKIRLKEEFKKALQDVRSRLNLSATENRIFEKEALSTADSFVETYSSSQDSASGQVRVQINDQKLLEFVRFSSRNKACLKVKAKTACKGCETWIPGFISGMKESLGARGMLVKSTDDIPSSANINGADAFEDFLARSTDLGCEASIFIEASSIHPEKKRLDFYVQVPDQTQNTLAKKIKFEFTVENLSEHIDSEQLISRATVGLYTGWQENRLKEKRISSTGDNFLVIDSVDQFSKLDSFKNLVTSVMPDVRLEERMISPLKFVFVVKSTRTMSEIAKELSSKGVQVNSASATEVQVSLR